ncbi:MAG: cupredoxin domain-containing protein [Nocardioidaceae bacterium]
MTAVWLAGVSGCSQDSDESAPAYNVTAGDDSCELDTTEMPAGAAKFVIENTGSDVTEVYVYGEEGGAFTKVIDEVEDITPGSSQNLDVDLAEGEYQLTCKPGMVGDGISTPFTVTGE